MNTEDSEFERIEREQAMRGVPDAIHHTDTSEPLMYIQGWNDCRQAMLAEKPAQQEPYGWHTEDHLTDRSATTYSKDVADRWKLKGWPVTPFYTTPQAQRKPLTEPEFKALYWEAKGVVQTDLMGIVRIVEHHHNIKENQS